MLRPFLCMGPRTLGVARGWARFVLGREGDTAPSHSRVTVIAMVVRARTRHNLTLSPPPWRPERPICTLDRNHTTVCPAAPERRVWRSLTRPSFTPEHPPGGGR